MIKRFVCAGSLNVDLTFPIERMPGEHEKLRSQAAFLSCGGSAANTAYWLARLGASVQMVGCVGDDPLGKMCIDELEQAGVDTHLIRATSRAATGVAAIFVNPSSKRMVTSGGANRFLDADGVMEEIYGPGVHLHIATPVSDTAIRLLRQAKSKGATTSCDLDEKPEETMLSLLDICFTNHSDLARWIGQGEPRKVWRQLATHSNLTLVVTQGARGATAIGPEGEFFVPATPVPVIDRTGGGDAFDAGFLKALAENGDRVHCLRVGLFMAAQVISREGSRPESADIKRAQAILAER